MNKETFSFFWGGPFSQWYPSAFTAHGISFRNAEQYMMWFKDAVFGGELEADILAESDPKKVKALGRSIKNFDTEVWNSVARPGVFVGNIAKFSQNINLLDELYSTTGTLVEASPFDRIWGIGLDKNDPRALNRETWNGSNWLGETLTLVRDTLTNVERTNVMLSMIQKGLCGLRPEQFAKDIYEESMGMAMNRTFVPYVLPAHPLSNIPTMIPSAPEGQ